MCWRDNQSNEDAWAEFREDQQRHHLQVRDAYKRCEVILGFDIKNDRPYFRKRYFNTLSGPTDTVEINLEEGTLVEFTTLANDVVKGFNLRPPLAPRSSNGDAQGRWKARVVRVEEEVGFSFGRAGSKFYFPLDSNDSFQFTVLSLPKSQRSA